MNFLKRVSLFVLTNLAVLVLLGIVMTLINIAFPGILDRMGGIGGILIYASVLGFGGAFISLLLSKMMAKMAYSIHIIDPSQVHEAHPKLQLVYQTVERIAQSSGITMPEVGYYESADPNAFATGASKNRSLVAVSTGLLNAMEKNEIEGVIGHEMAHILNGDMVTLTLITGVMNTFVIAISNIIARVIAANLSKDNENVSYMTYYLIYNLLNIVFGFLASFVIMYFSRIREYRADLGGAQFTSKSSMIAGLRKLKNITQLQPVKHEKTALTAFMINEPDSFFSTHPSLDNRIKALEENYQLA